MESCVPASAVYAQDQTIVGWAEGKSLLGYLGGQYDKKITVFIVKYSNR